MYFSGGIVNVSYLAKNKKKKFKNHLLIRKSCDKRRKWNLIFCYSFQICTRKIFFRMHLLLLCLGVFASQYYCKPSQNGFTDPLWIEFKLKFGRFYNTETEEAKRYTIFQENLKDINKHNNNPAHKYKKGINHFSDLVSFF